jgi:hypothetical protein
MKPSLVIYAKIYIYGIDVKGGAKGGAKWEHWETEKA